MVFSVPDWEDENTRKITVFSEKVKVKQQNGSTKKTSQKKANPRKAGTANGVAEKSKLINNKNKKQLRRQKLNNRKTDISNKEKVKIADTEKHKNVLLKVKQQTGKVNSVPEESNTLKKQKQERSRKINPEKNNSNSHLKVENFDTDKLDEVLITAKKNKFNEALIRDDVEAILFKEDKSPEVTDTYKSMQPRLEIKKEKIKLMLETSNRNSINFNRNKLRDRMLDRLKSAQFRFLNEKLYTSSGSEASQLFQEDPAAFHNYHKGYQQQVKKWPVNPLDVIVKRIQKMPKSHLIADMGCGEAALAERIPHSVRSFDLVSTAPRVEVCDMAETPLLSGSVDAVVYCLALMGTDLTKYLLEANRVLKTGGHLLIAEVESRFTDVNEFSKEVSRLGFKLVKLDSQHEVFFFMEFLKNQEPPVKKSKLPVLTLKPCIYKRR